MARFNTAGLELLKCSQCDGWRTDEEYDKDRHGIRRKGCIPCRLKREARKCPHGRQKLVCEVCSPGNFCEHGKCSYRHNCSVCDEVGNDRRKHIRNAREFAQQEDGWPFEHIRLGPQRMYDSIVNKWKETFAKLLKGGDIDEERHTRILTNLKPWDAEGHAKRMKDHEQDERLYRTFSKITFLDLEDVEGP